jgi:branched-chain amino acid transport system substrate-binding protein
MGAGGIVALSGCTGGSNQESPIKVGLNFPLSGGLDLMGTEAMRGVELGVDAINQDGGVDGREIEIIKRDAPNADAGVSNVQAFANEDDVDLIVGSFSSTIAKASSEAAARFEIPYWETTGFAPSISEPGYKNVYHTNARTTNYGQEAGRIIESTIAPQLEKTIEEIEIGILYENGEFGSATRDQVVSQTDEYGYQVVEEIGYPAFEVSDHSSAIERFKQAEPDIIYHSGYNADTNLFWEQAADLDFYVPAAVGNGTAYMLKSFVKAVGTTTARGIINVGQPHYNAKPEWSPRVSDVIEAYQSRYDELPVSQLVNTTYSSMEIFREAASSAASLNVDDFEEAVLGLDMPFGSLANGYGAKFDSDKHRNERVRVGGFQWQPDEYTDDIFHPDQNDGTLDVYAVYPDEARFDFISTADIPRPDYTG